MCLLHSDTVGWVTWSSGLKNIVCYLHLQTKFGDDRCTQFRVIVVTDPHTNKLTNTHTQTPQTGPITIHCAANFLYGEPTLTLSNLWKLCWLNKSDISLWVQGQTLMDSLRIPPRLHKYYWQLYCRGYNIRYYLHDKSKSWLYSGALITRTSEVWIEDQRKPHCELRKTMQCYLSECTLNYSSQDNTMLAAPITALVKILLMSVEEGGTGNIWCKNIHILFKMFTVLAKSKLHQWNILLVLYTICIKHI